jgi:hypothetical protein
VTVPSTSSVGWLHLIIHRLALGDARDAAREGLRASDIG